MIQQKILSFLWTQSFLRKCGVILSSEPVCETSLLALYRNTGIGIEQEYRKIQN